MNILHTSTPVVVIDGMGTPGVHLHAIGCKDLLSSRYAAERRGGPFCVIPASEVMEECFTGMCDFDDPADVKYYEADVKVFPCCTA